MSKIPCLICGALIVPDTVRKTRGLCIPCERQAANPISSEKAEKDKRDSQERYAPARAFAGLWKKEKQSLITHALDSLQHKCPELTPTQQTNFLEVIDLVLTDTMYKLLLGLDGCCSIGDVQETYKIYRENGVLISECGELEVAAYEAFHENACPSDKA